MKRHIKLSEGKLHRLVQSLGFLLEGGVPLEEALYVLGETEKSSRMSRLYRHWALKVNQGDSFYQLMDQAFYPMNREYLGLIRCGGAAGGIVTALKELEKYLDRRMKNKENLHHALVYPVFLMVLMMAGALLFSLVVLPRALVFFESLPGTDSSSADLLKQRMLGAKNALELFLRLFPLPVLLFLLWTKRPGDRTGRLDRFIDRLTPGIFRDRELYLYITTLSLLLHRGVPLSEALEKAGESLSGALNRWKQRRIMDLLSAGEPAGLVLLNEKLFPEPYNRWFSFSEMTGELNRGVELLQREYEHRLMRQGRRLSSWAEPVMICLAGGLLLLFASGLVLPLFEMMGTLL